VVPYFNVHYFEERTMRKFFVSILAVTLCGSVAAQGPVAAAARPAELTATISGVTGRVLVSTESGMMLAKPGMIIKAGQRIVTGVGSNASVSIGACSVGVTPSAEFRLAASDSCQGYAKLVKGVAQPVADVAQAELLGAPTGLATSTIAIGVAVAATGVAVVAAKAANDAKKKNASGS
jgi:hypothetical protein